MTKGPVHKILCVTIAALTMAVTLPGFAASSGLTLEGALDFTHVEDLAGSEAGTVAWAVKQRGIRNVWVRPGGETGSRALTSFREDDGLELFKLQISPDGRDVVFVRGGDLYGGGAAPNPQSLTEPPVQTIWLSRNLGKPKPVAEGAHPQFSPKGDSLIFVRDGQWYGMRLTRKGEQAPEPLFHVRGQVRMPTFDPSGESLAFVVDRGSHALIGLYRFGADAIRWIDPAMGRDLFPSWSPDGKRIAFLRYPGRLYYANNLFFRSERFEIRVVDVASGEARTVWMSPGADGGYPHEIGTPLAWADNETLVFQSEHTGWLSAFALDLRQGELTPLTPDACELTHSFVSARSGALVYASNCGDTARRHIWRADVATGGFSALTKGEGVELRPVPAGDGKIAYLSSRYDRSFGVSVINVDGTSKHRLGDLPRHVFDRFAKPHFVELMASDGVKSRAIVIEPNGPVAHKGKRPAVIFFHGGPYRQMFPGWHEIGYYSTTYALNQYMASRGYVVLSLNYRSGVGYGRAFRMADGQGPEGASEYADILAAADYLARRGDVDPKRIGVWGGSHGGVMTAWALARNSDLFAAGVDISGVHDWWAFARDQMGVGQRVLTAPAGTVMRAASPVSDIAGWRSPVLIVSGDDDRNVDVAQSIDLAARLKERNVPVEELMLPDEMHDFARYETWLTIARHMGDFFDHRLNGQKP